jgi:predicted methyltransferase
MKKILLVLSLVALSACAPSIQEAIDHPGRSDADRGLDAKRKPAEVITFFGINPGMKVLDIFGGGGYYTEILSYWVGKKGAITLYNNSPWNNFVTKSVTERLKDNRLPNVESLIVEPADLTAVNEQYDSAIFVLGMHDIYYVDEENGWPEIDKDAFLSNIYRLLKDGAVLGVIDHNAATGADPAEIGLGLHRVDPAVVIQDLEAVGFTLEAESNVLRNPDDDLTRSVFDKEIRWQSDRSVLRFRK